MKQQSKGRKGAKPRFEVGSYFGMQETTKSLDLLNAAEYALIKNEMFIRGTGSPIFNNTDLKMGTNWQDTIFQSSPIESFNLGVNGGGKNSSFSIGGNYFSQDGIVGGNKSSFERYNARVNLVNSLTEKLTLRSVFLTYRSLEYLKKEIDYLLLEVYQLVFSCLKIDQRFLVKVDVYQSRPTEKEQTTNEPASERASEHPEWTRLQQPEKQQHCLDQKLETGAF